MSWTRSQISWCGARIRSCPRSQSIPLAASWSDRGEIPLVRSGVSLAVVDEMGNLRSLMVAAALAQVAAPTPPANLRIVDAAGRCAGGTIGTPPNCFPMPPAPAAGGKQWSVTYAEEFNGTTLDPARLTPCFDWNFGACTASFNAGKER